MPLIELINSIRELSRNEYYAYAATNNKLILRIAEVFCRTWDLGLIAFGGPPVHFQTLYKRFVVGARDRTAWIDEQTYQELFAISQALPGPASTKMLFCVTLLHAGLVPAIMAFLLWSLPGAMGMFALSLGVQRISNILPGAVYALLSGLNASTVGIIALAAVQLAEKAIKDKLSRILVIFGACAGLCYSALWYFPLLIFIGGIATALWDLWLRQKVTKLKIMIQRRRAIADGESTTENDDDNSVRVSENVSRPQTRRAMQRRGGTSLTVQPNTMISSASSTHQEVANPFEQGAIADDNTISHDISLTNGLVVMGVFFALLTAIMIARGVVGNPPLPFSLFANMFLAGTIIFGGGTVVIPLLRIYVVEPGWVSSRDFLIGLAIIQAFPGPNFNFAVYLGALALLRQDNNTGMAFLGALLGYAGIFFPGLILAVGIQGVWQVLRTKPVVISLLRGVNATAVGLVFTAVYRLWEIGYLNPEASNGSSLALEPWWVVVATLTYAEAAWFGVPAAAAILFGAVLGLCWFGVVSR